MIKTKTKLWKNVFGTSKSTKCSASPILPNRNRHITGWDNAQKGQIGAWGRGETDLAPSPPPSFSLLPLLCHVGMWTDRQQSKAHGIFQIRLRWAKTMQRGCNVDSRTEKQFAPETFTAKKMGMGSLDGNHLTRSPNTDTQAGTSSLAF